MDYAGFKVSEAFKMHSVAMDDYPNKLPYKLLWTTFVRVSPFDGKIEVDVKKWTFGLN